MLFVCFGFKTEQRVTSYFDWQLHQIMYNFAQIRRIVLNMIFYKYKIKDE